MAGLWTCPWDIMLYLLDGEPASPFLHTGTPHKKWPFYGSFTWFLYQSDIFAGCPWQELWCTCTYLYALIRCLGWLPHASWETNVLSYWMWTSIAVFALHFLLSFLFSTSQLKSLKIILWPLTHQHYQKRAMIRPKTSGNQTPRSMYPRLSVIHHYQDANTSGREEMC